MRVSRLFRTILRLILLILTLCMSLISFLGGYSAIVILSDPDNIQVPDGDIYATLDVSQTENMSMELPYKITNAGFFDLTDIKIEMKIYLKYHDTRNPKNRTTSEKIVDADKEFPAIQAGKTKKGNFSLTFADGDFINVSYSEIGTCMDWTADPQVWYSADIALSARYSLGLLYFRVEMSFNLGKSFEQNLF